MLKSVVDEVFYVVESARHNINYENRRPEWGAWVALEMYQFYSALQEAILSAREIEQTTGFSGADLAARLAED